MPSQQIQTTISPIDGSAVKKIALPTDQELDAAISASVQASKTWRKSALKDRITIIDRFLEAIEGERDDIAKELTLEMGRPIQSSGGEVSGFLERGRWLCAAAEKSLADEVVFADAKFKKYLRKEALGVIFVISPWNYPYLCQANIVIPALLAGNTILIKPSPQTPSSSERIVRLLTAAGLPQDVAQVLHLTPSQMETVCCDPRVASVNFTGSVANGRRVEQAAARRTDHSFARVGLELGGKDAAYVRNDVDPAWAAEQVVDGAFFNSGQSCCAIERVYVHEARYEPFVEAVKNNVEKFKLGDPRDQATTLGPVISVAAARGIRAHYADAVSNGAIPLVDASLFPLAKDNTAFVNPQAFVDVTHDMLIMSEETFGPCIGIMKVQSDEEAVNLINDSQYGLTCSVWTKDTETFERLSHQIEAGTVYNNRCDYCDPSLAWTGLKGSGRGYTLSTYVFDAVTQLKSVHIKHI